MTATDQAFDEAVSWLQAAVPKDLEANVRWRIFLLDECQNDPLMQKLVMECCRRSIVFWIDCFGWTNDPRKKNPVDRVEPFVCWDYQEAILLATPEKPYVLNVVGREVVVEKGIRWCKDNSRSAVVEKSRDMGATWLFMFDQVHDAIFQDYAKSLNISHSEQAVDNGTPDCLFWKMDHIVQHLPDWMVDKGRYEYHDSRIRFADTKSIITGVASKASSSAGGRARYIFCDEFSLVREDTDVRTNAHSVADSVFYNGTHRGQAEFYNLTREADIVKIQAHWTQHPLKRLGLYRSDPSITPADGPNCHQGYEILDVGFEYDEDFKFNTSGDPKGGPFPGIRSPWYDKKCKEIRDPRGIAMDLDINPDGTSSHFFNREDVSRYIDKFCQPALWEGDLNYDSETLRPIGLVPRTGGNLKLWINPKAGGRPEPGAYVVAIDPSWGVGATPSCVSIANAITGEKVGEFTDAHIRPGMLARFCVAACWLFADEYGQGAKMIWEIQGPGSAFGKEISDQGYSNVYYRVDEMRSFKVTSENPGWSSSSGNKRALLEAYRMALWDGKFTNRSEQAMKECLQFVYTNNDIVHQHYTDKNADPAAARENHADHVIADALAWKLIAILGKIVLGEDKRPPEPLLSPNTLAGRWRLADNRRKQQAKWS